MSGCRARLRAVAWPRGVCDQETCPDLNECHVVFAQNTLKIMRLANSYSCAN